MVKSMTGYGKAECLLPDSKITIEIRSLNGKNADISIKSSLIPREKEMAVRQYIAKELQRGNIDLFATIEQNAAESAKKINMELAMDYFKQITALGNQVGACALQSQNPNDLLASCIACSKNILLSGVPTIQIEIPLLLISCVSIPTRLLPCLLFTTF